MIIFVYAMKMKMEYTYGGGGGGKEALRYKIVSGSCAFCGYYFCRTVYNVYNDNEQLQNIPGMLQ